MSELDCIYALDHISKVFTNRDGEVIARGCDDLSLTVRRGDFLAITGESGSGKSTLLSLLGFLATPHPLPEREQFQFSVEGERHDLAVVLRGGIGSRRLSQWRADHVGFVFQNFHLLNHLTSRANVALGLRFASGGGSDPDAVLDSLGMTALAHKRTRDLSGGQKQRVSVARALVKRPAVLLADEPTGNLDTANKCLVLAALLIANRRFDATVVLVTHEIEHPPRVANRSIVMRDGRIAESHSFTPTVGIRDDDTVVDLAKRIAKDCYPAVYRDLKWD